MTRIAVVGTEEVDAEVVRAATAFVARTFVIDAIGWPARADLEPSPDAVRRQVMSTEVLRRLLALVPDAGTRVLGITERDLYLPTLTFVFGHAQLDGHVALVSMYRLRQENVGLAPDPDLLWERLQREIAHELGHTYGLRHCARRNCCMSLSTSIEEVDAKNADFCRSCRSLVREAQRRERIRNGVERPEAGPREERGR